MPRTSKTGSTLRQIAYARQSWGAKQETKRQIALDVGYTHNVANSVVSKIESTRGYNNAVAKLAAESNMLALSIMHEFKARGVQDFSNKELISAMSAISNAWGRFNKGLREAETPVDNGKNKLRTIILQNINKQTLTTAEQDTSVSSPALNATHVDVEVMPDLDF